MNYTCVNGKMVPANQPILFADNRGYRYGDGLFETMKVLNKKICSVSYHFERFFSGLKLLQFEVPAHLDEAKLTERILVLCEKNQCDQLARVRLSVSRGNGGLYEKPGFHYIIECWPANESVNQLNANGLVIGIYSDARKSSDAFSHLKSANFLPYVMAAQYARQHKLNDCLVFNHHDRIADATIANLFLIKNNILITPPLSEGGVGGVMRKQLLEKCPVEEKPVTPTDVLDADEVFLTNAMNGIRWVKQCGDKLYGNTATMKIYNEFVKTIWE
ncbi:MAG: aminotransferase class IV [Chitinophagaceae bacterium]